MTFAVWLAMSFAVYADDLILADPATGCKVWGGDDPAASHDVVSWSGACRDGLAHGPGVLSWFSQGDLTARYKGTMLAGRADGAGVLHYRLADGFALIQGRFFEGLPHGSVAVRYANGDRFSGTVEHGLDKGAGIYWLADGAKFKGTFSDGMFNGPAASESPDGEVFQGVFKDNQRHSGVVIYPDGGRYQGAFSAGQPGGKGEYRSPDGEHYRGQFLKGFPDGEVEVTFADGRTETQVWANGARSEP